ncbi:hypothetical protein ACNI65_06290 [Roseateles sp. So40a]|uniref:hypothetical protein n=1 Tax=Roseateles sp. So40a TaxID=3400226 RepID=UPI003A89F0F1
MKFPTKLPSLAQRHAELNAMKWPDSRLYLTAGRELRYVFSIAPTVLSRVYRCMVKLKVSGSPEAFVLEPDLVELAGGRRLPHVYPHEGRGTKLCLWLPRAGEWSSELTMQESYLPWTAEWLNYFEEWLVTDEWAGGGEHPVNRQKRWMNQGRFMVMR